MIEKPSIGAGKPFPDALPSSDKYVVDFEGVDDPYHPQNWKLSTK
jgi:DHA1 family multidrug resistance protein-like MFS transporter